MTRTKILLTLSIVLFTGCDLVSGPCTEYTWYHDDDCDGVARLDLEPLIACEHPDYPGEPYIAAAAWPADPSMGLCAGARMMRLPDSDAGAYITDCDDQWSATHPGGREMCSGQRDEDCDGLRDCEDPDCVASAECCVWGIGPGQNCQPQINAEPDGLTN